MWRSRGPVFVIKFKIFSSAYHRNNAAINVRPQDGGGGRAFQMGGDVNIWVLPWGREFDIAKTCFGQKAVPRGGNLNFSRCPGVGNLTLALVKMSNSLGSTPPPPTLELNIDKCITFIVAKNCGHDSC